MSRPSASLSLCIMLTTLCLGSLTACKSSPEDKPAPDTQEPVGSFTPDENQRVMPDGFEDKTVPGSDTPGIKQNPTFSQAERDEIMIALGCPEPLIRGEECQVCPTVDPGVPMATPIKSGPNTPFQLMRGDYVKGTPQQVVASIHNCTDAEGHTNISQLALLTRASDGESWAIKSATVMPHVVECEVVDTLNTTTRTLCRIQENGKHGLINAFHAVSWGTLAKKQSGERPKPLVTPLVVANSGAGCAQNWSIKHTLAHDLKDADGDGTYDLMFDVTTEEGAYLSPLDECMDGTFDAPLTPARTLTTKKTSLVYRATDQGFEETSGQPSTIALSPEFQALLDK